MQRTGKPTKGRGNKMENEQVIYKGSAKNLLVCDADSLFFDFLDTFSIFDVGKAEQTIPGKGRAICACAVESYQIAESLGIPTCFIGQISTTRIRVKKAVVPKGKLLTTDTGYVAPVEWIYRLRSAGSLQRGFEDGSKNPVDYGFLTNDVPKVGTQLPYPVRHTTTKFEDVDRDIGIEEVVSMSGLTMDDYQNYWDMIFMLVGAIRTQMMKNGFDVLDGKMEMLMMKGRVKMIGDVFGTPDEDRPVLLSDLEKGVLNHYNKEYIREYFSEYHELVKLARKQKTQVPSIPTMPDDVLEEVSRRYIALAEAYSGVSIRV